MQNLDSGLKNEKSGRYRAARSFYEAAARLMKAHRQDPTPANWSLGANYYYWGRTTKARKYFRAVLQKANHLEMTVTMLSNLGDTYNHRDHQPAKAARFYNRIRQLPTATAEDQAWAWLNLGQGLAYQQRWQEARDHFQQAWKLWQTTDNEARILSLSALLEAWRALDDQTEFEITFGTYLELRAGGADRSQGGGLIALLSWPDSAWKDGLIQQAGFSTAAELAITLETECAALAYRENLVKLYLLPLFPIGYRRANLTRVLKQMGYDRRQIGRLISGLIRL